MKISISKEHAVKFNDTFKYCIGTGRLGLALRREYIDGLRQVVKDIGFKYIRGHGLFCDDVGIYREYTENGETKAFYNFTYIDQIFDEFLDIGIKPFIELGFMPGELASGSSTVFWWRGNVTPPRCYDGWNGLVKATIEHFIERYGLDEVLSWPIEVWNEPNLINFWKDADMDEYFKLYKNTVTTIKAIDERLQVGGPAICGGGDHWMEDFLNFCEKENLPVDFLSRHAYATGPTQAYQFIEYQTLHPREYLLKDFKSGREYLARSAYPNLPVHITEFNTSYTPLNPIHDTAHNAAYLGKILSEGGDYVDSFSYWTFSDVFEEKDIPTSLFHGGFGLLAYNLIKKPTYYIYEFFARLKGDTLFRNDNLIATFDDGVYRLVLWNQKSTGLELEIDLPVESDVFVLQKVVNEKYGNGFNAWRDMGRPRFPSKCQVEIIQSAALPKVKTKTKSPKNGLIDLKIKLKENEIRLIEIYPRHIETQPYLGLDDSKIGTSED